MRARRAAVAAGGVTTLLLALAAPAALAQDAASVTMTGWWTRLPTASAPEGGFAVSQAPDGPTSVAAVGLMVLDDPESVTLVLTEDEVLGAPELRVCPTPNQWMPEEPGAWEDRPREECAAGEAELVRDEAAGTWSADVTFLVQGDESQMSLMIVPAEEESPLAPTFRATFSEANVTAPAAEGAGAGAGAGGPATSPAPSPAPSGDATFTAPSPPPAAPAAPAPPQPHEPVPEDGSAGPVDDAPDDDQVAFTPVGPGGASPISEDRPWGQAFFFLGVAALVGLAAGVGRRQLRTLGWIGTG